MRRTFLAATFAPLLPLLAAAPLPPSEAPRSFELADPELSVQLVAAEPLIESPCALAFDEKGQLFVAENRGYPNTSEPAQGRIALLRDRDGDGAMDSRVTFAEGLTYPNGVLPWRGGLIVTCAPDVLFLKDTDGDGRADERRVLLTGFATTGSTQLRVNAPTLGPDGWIYLAAGLSGGEIRAPEHPERPAVKMTADVRFHPETLQVESVDGRSQYGMSFDDFGSRFICMNRLPVQHVVFSSRWLRRNPHLAFSDTVQDAHDREVKSGLRGGGAGVRLFPISSNVTTADSHAGSFSAACGVFVWPGGSLPERYGGVVFSCDPTGNLVHADRLEPHGASFAARPMFAGKEFLASRDDWFRPVALNTGPDGALYIADMYRLVIEHPDYLPEEVRKRTDFESGKSMGRIWRVTQKGARSPRRMVGEDPGLQLLALASADGWTRQTAFRRLVETPAPLESLKHASADLPAVSHARLLQLIALQRGLDAETLQRATGKSDARLRETVLQLWMEHSEARTWLPDPSVLANEQDERLRMVGALALGEIREGVPALAAIAAQDADDRWCRAAVLSAIAGREKEFVEAFADVAKQMGAGEMEVLRSTARAFAKLADMRAAFDPEGKVLKNPRMAVALLLGVLERSGEKPVDADAWLNATVQAAATMARDAKLTPGERSVALSLLGRLSWEQGGEALLALATDEPVEEVRVAAIRAIATFPRLEVTTALLTPARWKVASSTVRETLLDALLGRPEHAPGVLAAVAEQRIPASAIPTIRRNALIKHKDPAIREHAEKLFGRLGGDRKAAFEASKAALALQAKPAHGRELFQQLCATCHRLDRAGYAVGPDLLDIRNQTKENILFHIVVPDAEIAPAFAAYVAELRDGRSISGVMASETPTSVTLRGPLGQETSVLRSELKSIEALPTSLMPAGLEQAMSLQALADLVAYLKGE